MTSRTALRAVAELDAFCSDWYRIGAAAGGADGFGVDADDLAELPDDHKPAGLVDEAEAETLPILGVVFMLMTPLQPRDWRRYWSTSVRLP